MAARRKALASASKRGYGRAHQRMRKVLEPQVAAGDTLCARCGELILPGQRWDLGHVDGDRSRYSGPEHALSADCAAGGNRATAGRGRQVWSRRW